MGAHKSLRLKGQDTREKTPCATYDTPRSCSRNGMEPLSPMGMPCSVYSTKSKAMLPASSTKPRPPFLLLLLLLLPLPLPLSLLIEGGDEDEDEDEEEEEEEEEEDSEVDRFIALASPQQPRVPNNERIPNS